MFVFNIRVNGSKLFKIFFTLIVLLVIAILIFICVKTFFGAKNEPTKNENSNSSTSTCLPETDVYQINSQNYSTILKTVHEDIDSYVGLQINFVGYVYRVSDFEDNQFVLARNMYISDIQYVVVGFLCECDNAKDFNDNTWVEVTGEITKGYYHADIPVIKISEIKEAECPEDENVPIPDETYIPTSGIL